MRQVNVDAITSIDQGGFLKKKKWEIYQTLFQSDGNLTHGELSILIESKYETVYGGKPRKFYRNNIVARLGELRNEGWIRETVKRICKNSNRVCTTWDVTNQIEPLGPSQRKKTASQQISELMLALNKAQEKIAKLETDIGMAITWGDI